MQRWGTWTLGDVLKPAIKLATDGFKVDRRSPSRPRRTRVRFAAFPATSAIYLPGGATPAVGSVLKNEDLADTYKLLADKGVKAFYGGKLAARDRRRRPAIRRSRRPRRCRCRPVP